MVRQAFCSTSGNTTDVAGISAIVESFSQDTAPVDVRRTSVCESFNAGLGSLSGHSWGRWPRCATSEAAQDARVRNTGGAF